MKKICLLVSGGLGFKILLQIYHSPRVITAVFTNRSSKDIITFCKQHKIDLFIGNPRGGKATDFIANIKADILLSVNYLYLIEQDLIALPKEYAINVHGSLLPKYRGRTPHVWAIINGEKETGITAHLIDEIVDNGAIIKQEVIPISSTDTGGSILEKFKSRYPIFLNEILEEIDKGTIQLSAQDNKNATYFGKRTPADGQINWEWSKERIINWVRAQAKPYPGAFTFLQNNKIIIHKAVSNPLGFDFSVPNGTILEVFSDRLIVKVCNGALLLSEMDVDNHVRFNKGIILK